MELPRSECVRRALCDVLKMTIATDKTTPVILKHVDVDALDISTPFKVFILNKPVDISSLMGRPECKLFMVAEFEEMLEAVESIPVCRGGPHAHEFTNVSPECAAVDSTGVWRHRKCVVFGNTDVQCCSCSSLSKTLSVHAARKRMRQRYKHVRLVLSPAKQEKVEKLRKAKIASYKAKLLLRNRLTAIKGN